VGPPDTHSFDALRAEMWRTVARPDLHEDELIQAILELLGPALRVSRACYNERESPDGDLVTVAEWTAPGIKPTLGEHIPAMLLRPVEEHGEFEVSVEAYAEALPRLVRPLARAALGAIFRAQDLASVFVMAYAVDGYAEGALTLDLVTAQARPRGWSAEVRPIVADAIQIVGLAVARQRAARARDASELRYRAVVDRLAEGVAITDLEERFVLANPRAAEIFGVPPRRLVGRSLHDFLDEPDWRKVRAESQRRGRGESSTYELRVRRPDGTARSLLLACTPERDAAGRVTGGLGVFHDITDRQRAEEERRALELRMLQAQKLESLGILAGGIAHDFNNLLAVMRGNVDLALQQLAPGTPVGDRLATTVRALDRATDLSQQMLAYAGRGKFQVQPHDLSALVAEIAQMLTVSVPKKARLELDCPDGLPAVEADASQLQQVVMNLVTNAAESLGDGEGTVTVRTGLRECDAAFFAGCEGAEGLAPGRYLFLGVADTGCGMTPEVRARLFEPFFSTKFAGRGLGLAALLGIVRAHRGAVAVDSAPPRGTRITVVLPCSSRPAAKPEAPPAAPLVASQPGATVLFVDDEEDIREMAEQILTGAGYRVLLAGNGAEAVERYAAARREVSCVVLDLTMPRLDGVETVEALEHIDPDVRVIVSSGFDGRDVAARLDRPPVVGFLKKPYPLATLIAAVESALRR
jgi:PAS domain S-box-containing protein